MHPSLVYWDLNLPIFAVQAGYNVQWTPIGWKKSLILAQDAKRMKICGNALGVSWWNGVPRKVPWPKPEGPEVPRDSIHHNTPLAFPQIVPIYFSTICQEMYYIPLLVLLPSSVPSDCILLHWFLCKNMFQIKNFQSVCNTSDKSLEKKKKNML